MKWHPTNAAAAKGKLCPRCLASVTKAATSQDGGRTLVFDLDDAGQHAAWLLAVKGCKCSRGLGDTVARITAATGIAAVAHAVSKVTGKDCGCKARQAKLNRAFPYTSSPKES